MSAPDPSRHVPPLAAGAYSLRRRLIAWVLGASVAMWLVSMVLVVHVAWRETSDVFDDALKEGARLALVLGSTLQANGALAGEEHEDAPGPAKLKLYYQIIAADGSLLRRAEGAPSTPFVASSAETPRKSGYATAWAEGRAWRVYSLHAEGEPFQVQVGQPWEERLDLLDEIAEDLLWPALAMLLLLAGFCWFIIRRLLQPMEYTARQIAAKAPDDLTPIPFAQEPRELRPIVLALNGVLARLSRAIEAERRFTADAAHELVTPLAALRMRIQLMQRQQNLSDEDGSGPAGAALQDVRDQVDRCTALVDSLLVLTRLDPQTPQSLQTEWLDLAAVFSALDDGSFAKRRIQFQIRCEVASLKAHPSLLRSALRNLVDNAVRYGSSGHRVEVSAVPWAGGTRVAVRDNGPGVKAADRQRLTKRFFRVLGSETTGSGLGLSIVARIAALHGATLSFGDGIDGAGLGVQIDFPA